MRIAGNLAPSWHAMATCYLAEWLNRTGEARSEIRHPTYRQAHTRLEKPRHRATTHKLRRATGSWAGVGREAYWSLGEGPDLGKVVMAASDPFLTFAP